MSEFSEQEQQALGGMMDDRFGCSHLEVVREQEFEAGWQAARSFYACAEVERLREALRDAGRLARKALTEPLSDFAATNVGEIVHLADALSSGSKESDAGAGCAVCGSQLIGSCTLPECPNPLTEVRGSSGSTGEEQS